MSRLHALRRTMLATFAPMAVAVAGALPAALPAQGLPESAFPPAAGSRPFGTLREQAEVQQRWLELRMRRILPALMQRHGVELWVVPMREYNEDPVFSSIVSPTTFAARRRTIYVFHNRCLRTGATDPGDGSCVDRIALGGTSQGGVYQARRAMKAISGGGSVGGRQAELWGDEQWQVLRQVLEERQPQAVHANWSTTFAFTDGLTHGEWVGMTAALGEGWTAKLRAAEHLPLELIAARLPEEEAVYRRLQALVWSLTQEMFSARVIVPGTTRTSDLVWWWRQRVNDLGLGTWFQPSVSVQRRGATAEQLGEDPVIERGDVLHCDVGITAMGLNTDTQHNAYVLLPGESTAPAGLAKALADANRLQDIVMAELRPGRTGNEVLAASLARMRAEGIDGTVYSHPIGMHGHGAGPLVGLWDYQEGVPGRGDAPVIGDMWYSIELQATTPVPEWGGQPVRMAQEEDAIVPGSGAARWALKRQDGLFLVR